MNKLLQFVALLLTLSVPAQPLLAKIACHRPSCTNQRTMHCCQHAGSMATTTASMPGMDCDGTSAAGPMIRLCMDDGCCAVSAQPTAQLPTPRIAAVSHQATVPTPAFMRTPSLQAPVRLVPGLADGRHTARYILFHDFRI
jgi:hypothetical protein